MRLVFPKDAYGHEVPVDTKLLKRSYSLFLRQPRIFKTAVHVVRVMGLIVLDAG